MALCQRCAEVVFSFYDTTIEQFATKKIRTFSIKELTALNMKVCATQFTHTSCDYRCVSQPDESTVVSSANFVARQLPIRIARRLMDLHTLPYLMVENPYMKKVSPKAKK